MPVSTPVDADTTRDDEPRPRPRWVVPAALLAAVLIAVGLWLTQPWLLFVDVTAEESLPVTLDTAAADGAADSDTTGSGDEGSVGDEAEAEDRMGTTAGQPDGAAQADAADGGAAADDTEPTADADAEPAADADDDAAEEDPAADDAAAEEAAGEEAAGEEAAGEEAQEPTGPVVLSQGSFISRDHQTSGNAAIVELEDDSRVLTIEGLATDNGPDLFVYLDDDAADAPEDDFDDGISLGRLRANQGDLVYEIPADVDLDQVTSVGIWCDRFSSLFGAADLVPQG